MIFSLSIFLSFPSTFTASNIVNNAGHTPLSPLSELLTLPRTMLESYNIFGTFEIFSPDIYRVRNTLYWAVVYILRVM